MSDPQDPARRWASRRASGPRRDSAAAATAAAPAYAPQQQTLSAPPPGFGWLPTASGYVLVAIGGAAPAGAVPAPPVHYVAPPPAGAGGRVIPIRPKGTQLLRQGNKDPWAEQLERLPDLAPQQAGHFFDALAPAVEDVQGLPEMAQPFAANPSMRANEDPSSDAFPQGVPASKSGDLPGANS